MVYKKYIKRNGKIYGPYIYHSKRIDGKVVSEYRGGLKKPKKYGNLLLIFGILCIVILVIIFLISSEKPISGQATLDLNADYKEGELLKGKLDISLKEGEFIPADSKIVFENNGNIKEFDFKDFVSEESDEGEFYIEGKNIQGTGEGYGSKGSSEEYAEVYFELNIYMEEDTEMIGGDSSGSGEKDAPEVPVEEPVEEVVEETPEVPVEEPVEETPEVESVVESEPVEETPEVVVEEVVNEPEPVEEAIESSPITGNFFVRISNFFLALTPTGNVVLELGNTVEGKVSFGEEFVYELQPGESAELQPLSVRTSSGEKLSDNEVSISVEGNRVIVITNYAEKEKGYGKDFLGEEIVQVSIDLEDLNLEFEKGELNIKVVYEGSEILNLKGSLGEEGITLEEIPEEPPEEVIEEEINETENNQTIGNLTDVNETIKLNDTNQTIENQTINIMSVEPLSIQEKARLLGYFGDSPIEIIKSEKFKDRFIVGYKLGNYEIEFSYDSSISQDLLDKVMENDRIIWLRDLSKSLGSEDTAGEEINITNSTNFTLKNI